MSGEPSTTATSAMPADRATNADSAIALEAFVAAHYDRLIQLAWLVCRDGADAGDAVQVGLELAWKRRGTLRDQASLRPWLDRIVVREAGRIAKRRRGLLARIFSPPAVIGWVDLPDRQIPDHDERMTLRSALGRLSPDHRAVIALHLHAGYSVAETAALVGAPVETVRSRLRVAREYLRRDLGEAIR